MSYTGIMLTEQESDTKIVHSEHKSTDVYIYGTWIITLI